MTVNTTTQLNTVAYVYARDRARPGSLLLDLVDIDGMTSVIVMDMDGELANRLATAINAAQKTLTMARMSEAERAAYLSQEATFGARK